jgi:hypothetical protein
MHSDLNTKKKLLHFKGPSACRMHPKMTSAGNCGQSRDFSWYLIFETDSAIVAAGSGPVKPDLLFDSHYCEKG